MANSLSEDVMEFFYMRNNVRLCTDWGVKKASEVDVDSPSFPPAWPAIHYSIPPLANVPGYLLGRPLLSR